MKRFATAAFAVAIGLGCIGAASAQAVIADPGIISGCLCQEQGVALLKSRVDQARQLVEEDRTRLDSLDRDIMEARGSVDTSVPGQVDAVRALSVEREQLHTRTFETDIPALKAATQNYNGAARRYGAKCTAQNFDETVLTQVRASLSCPPMPEGEPPAQPN